MDQAKWTDRIHDDDEEIYSRMDTAMENAVDSVVEEVLPLLKTKANAQLTYHGIHDIIYANDNPAAPPHTITGLNYPEIKQAYEGPVQATAEIFSHLHKYVADYCRFEDHQLLKKLHHIATRFNHLATPGLKQLGLQHHQFEGLALLTSEKLGHDFNEVTHKHSDRHQRSKPKDIERIVAALQTCVDMAPNIRPYFQSDERLGKFDSRVDSTKDLLSNLPAMRRDTPEEEGDLIKKLLHAGKKMLQAGNWISKHDVLHASPSQSQKITTAQAFEELKIACRGQSDLPDFQ